MSNCKVCLAAIRKNQFKLVCSDCAGEFHGKCVKMNQEDADFLKEAGSVWRCEQCNSTRRKSMRLEYSSAEGGVTLETIMTTLKEMQEDQRRNVAEFNKSYEALHTTMEENTQTLKGGMEKIEEYIKEIEQLRSENTMLKGKVVALETRIEDLEAYSRRNCLEIQGVSEEGNEDVMEVVKSIGQALNMDINDSMIDACHRVGKRNEDNRPRGIIVKFVRRIDKEVLMKRRRERKRDFTTRHLGLPTDSHIYLNDSLTPARRRLLFLARQMKKDKGYKYLWMRNSNILLRKEEGSPVIEVKNQADLSKL